MLSSIPRGRPALLRSFGAVCCLRRDMIGSPIPPFRVVLSRGCKVHLMLGLRLCFLPQEQYCSLKAFDTPLRHEDLSPYPESATRRSGAYRDGTFTRKSETAGMLATSGHPFRTHHGLDDRPRFGGKSDRRPGSSSLSHPFGATEAPRRGPCQGPVAALKAPGCRGIYPSGPAVADNHDTRHLQIVSSCSCPSRPPRYRVRFPLRV